MESLNNKIIVICGFSASGKDKITKYISDNWNYNMIISTTSRPIRPNEYENNPYHFVTRQEFENMISRNKFIECRKYNTLVNNIPDIWYYGVHKDSINLSKNNYVVVLDLLGLIEFKKHFNDNIISFFIDVDETTRRNRCINRNDFNEKEWNRRYADDIKQFSRELIEKEVNYIVENYNFNECINKIKEKLNE